MAVDLTSTAREQTRAREPDATGAVIRDGVNLAYEIYGSGEPTVLLMPTWSIIHSRHWKMQIPYLARHCRVLVFDGRGNGRSDRPETGYEEREFAADALAVMDATATDRAILVALSLAVVSTVIVVAPVASHRILFRRRAKTELVSAADRSTKAGLATLALTIVAVVVLVFGFVAGTTAAVVAGVVAIAFFVVQWVVVPSRLLGRVERRPDR